MGATGSVGQNLSNFFPSSVVWHNNPAASNAFGKNIVSGALVSIIWTERYRWDACRLRTKSSVSYCFSGLDSDVAGDIETRLRKLVILSFQFKIIAWMKRFHLPEVNSIIRSCEIATFPNGGMIITNPNWPSNSFALKPLVDHFGVEKFLLWRCSVVWCRYPGVSSLDIIDNMIPFIGGEEQKMETEPLKIFGTMIDDRIVPSNIRLASCNRIAVVDGHMGVFRYHFQRRERGRHHCVANVSYRTTDIRITSAPTHPTHYFLKKIFNLANIVCWKWHDGCDRSFTSLSDFRMEICFAFAQHDRGAGWGDLNAELL